MKRTHIALIAAAFALGCEHNEETKKSSTENMKPTAQATDAAKSASAKPASAKEYYEVTKNGKTYVFGNVDAVLAFRSTGALPPGSAEKPAFGPNGETVVFQTGNGIEAGLIADYQKAHPKK